MLQPEPQENQQSCNKVNVFKPVYLRIFHFFFVRLLLNATHAKTPQPVSLQVIMNNFRDPKHVSEKPKSEPRDLLAVHALFALKFLPPTM